ncbi:MAG: hypothetical protein OEX07_05235 [Gammaproteobacteria bacterium]|nr:hypothetical protein [Gammaproteobacteria bacterium]
MKVIFSIIIFALLAACGGDHARTPPQQWKDLTFMVETRPPELRPGMIEFLVLANRGSRKRAHDLLVSIRIGRSGRWVQSIQDGNTGVYRRALKVTDPETDILSVHIKHKDEEKLFEFPLSTLLPEKPAP